MTDYELKNAIISSATLTIDDHGCLSAWLRLEYDEGGQGFGGFALHLLRGSSNHRSRMPYAGHFITRVLQVAGVKTWEDLKGKTIRVRASHSDVAEIGHIIKEDWFNPRMDFAEIKKAEELAEAKVAK